MLAGDSDAHIQLRSQYPFPLQPVIVYSSACLCVCVCALAHNVCVLCVLQMETEPVVASEPVFSVGQTVRMPCHVPAIPNGSSTQVKLEERSGKLTAEQLAAIEDEELLDKMVPYTQVIILDDLYFKTTNRAAFLFGYI